MRAAFKKAALKSVSRECSFTTGAGWKIMKVWSGVSKNNTKGGGQGKMSNFFTNLDPSPLRYIPLFGDVRMCDLYKIK